MQVHPRTRAVHLAISEFSGVALDFFVAKGLTKVESLQAVNAAGAMVLSMMLREERHPDDPEKPADLA